MKTGKVLLIVLSIVFFLSSCTKVSEEVIGTWTFQTFDDRPQGVVNWTFKDDGMLIRVLTYDAVSSFSGGISFDTANYVVDKSFLRTRIVISGSDPLWSPSGGMGDANGTFRIDEMKDDILIMTRIKQSDDQVEGSYLRCELLRKM